MIRLDADSEHAELAHGVAAARDVADFGRGENEVLVAHDLRDGGRDFGNDGPLKLLQGGFSCRIVEDEFAELADGEAFDLLEALLVECVENQAGDVVAFGIDQGLADDFVESQVGELALGGDALLLRAGGNSCKLVAGLLLIGFGEKIAEIGKDETFCHGAPNVRRDSSVEGSINSAGTATARWRGMRDEGRGARREGCKASGPNAPERVPIEIFVAACFLRLRAISVCKVYRLKSGVPKRRERRMSRGFWGVGDRNIITFGSFFAD